MNDKKPSGGEQAAPQAQKPSGKESLNSAQPDKMTTKPVLPPKMK